MFAYVVVVNSLFVGLNCYMRQEAILLLTALASALYYTTRLTHEKTPMGLAKVLSGEAPHQLLYLLWLYSFPKNEYIYYVPLALSCVGKINLLLSGHCEDSLEKAQ